VVFSSAERKELALILLSMPAPFNGLSFEYGRKLVICAFCRGMEPIRALRFRLGARPDLLVISRQCEVTRGTYEVIVNLESWRAWADGADFMRVFSYLSDEQREFLLSNITPAEWDKWVKSQPDENEDEDEDDNVLDLDKL
jgi:hypothetical protein